MAGIMVGDTLSSYRIRSRAGQGRTGTIYLAERMPDGRRVCLKVLHPEIAGNPERAARIVSAARAIMEIGHPAIPRVLEIKGDGGDMAIAAEWVDGESVADRMLVGPLNESEAIRIGAAVADAVAAAHDHGLGDLGVDAAHVLITPSGSIRIVGLEPGSLPADRTEHEARRNDLVALGALLAGMTRGSESAGPDYARLIDACRSDLSDDVPGAAGRLAGDLARLAGAADSKSRRWVGTAVLSIVTLMLLVAAIVRAAGGREQPADAVVVLPFETASTDADEGDFGIGLADSIIGHLSRAQGLIVRPMSAVMHVSPHMADPLEAARRLQASLVLIGRYARDENLRVDVTLLEAATGATLWTDKFTSRPGDPRLIEEAIVDQLLERLHPGAAMRLPADSRTRGRPDPLAHHLYLLARGRMASHESRPVSDAVRLLEEATADDPGYASAQAALAEASANMFLGGLSSDRAWLSRGIAAGRRAVLLDDSDPTAHFSLGYALLYSGDPIAAATEILRSVEIDPAYAEALRVTSGMLAQAGAMRPARLLRDRALGVDPTIYPSWVDVYLAVGEGKIAEAARSFEEELDRRRREGRSFEIPVQNLAFLAFETGDTAASLRWAAMLEELTANFVYADVVRLLAFSRMGDAATVASMIERSRNAYWADWEYSLWVGRALALVGNGEEALTWLAHSAAIGAYDISSFRRVELPASLKPDPRYQQALASVRGRAQAIVDQANLAGFR